MKVGERFPISDPNKQPVLSPKPLLDDGSGGVCRRQYLHGILQRFTLTITLPYPNPNLPYSTITLPYPTLTLTLTYPTLP